MAKQTLFKLEHGDIEFNDDGETKVYSYKGKPFDQLTEDEIAEVRNDPTMQALIKSFKLLAEAVSKIFEDIRKVVVPVFNEAFEKIQKAEAEAEKAKKKKAKPAKKGKTDEAK